MKMALTRCGRLISTTRKFYTSSGLNQGYIVLVPEIGEDAPEKNPLYHTDGLPKFNQITIENCRAAIAKQTLDFEVGVQEIEKQITENPCVDVFKDIVVPLEHLGHVMETTWGLSKTLYLGNNTLMPTSSYMAIHDRARRARFSKFTSKKIHFAMKEEFSKEKKRSSEEDRILKKYVLEGRLNGLELSEKISKSMLYNLSTLAKERSEFKHKNDISTKQHAQVVSDRTIVRDFPDDLLKAVAVDPSYHLNGPWKFTLQPHVYFRLLEHCPNRDIRWLLWKSNVNRGSVGGERELATSLHVEEIRFLKADIAKLLGYNSCVDMSMETKMAGSKQAVDQMFESLLERAKPAQDEELEVLLEYANERGFKTDRLELWDIPYWRRKHRISLYNYEEEKFKEYFPLNKVLDGLFELSENLFNIVIKARTGVTTWHKDVRFYDIFESHSSAPIASFYLDPYARSDDKLRVQNPGWMIGMQSKSQVTDSKPLASLIFNFEPPKGEFQSHLTFEEVRSLFQKFGHALQHLLTRTYYSEVAGSSNVEWDAVEVCSNVLPHWLYNKKVIDSITSHRDSGDTLPQSMFQTLCDTQKHMAGYDLCREMYLSALDLELYSSKDFWMDIVKRLWPKYRSFEYHIKYDAHPCSFMQIFTDEWGAAYYSHLWARMIAADVYSAFHEVRDNDQQIRDVGKRFRDTFLALGGSEHPGQVFREFRGRDPSPKALLKSLGIKKVNESI